MKLIVILFCAAAIAGAQCPGKGETDVNTAPPEKLATLLGIDSAASIRLAREIRITPFRGFADMAPIARRYRFKIPAELVVCAPPVFPGTGMPNLTYDEPPSPKQSTSAASADSVDIRDIPGKSINVNSASEQDLASFKLCGVTDKEIREIALFNMRATRFNDQSLAAFLEKHPSKTSSCDALNFKFSSR